MEREQSSFEREQEDAAASEAAEVGGRVDPLPTEITDPDRTDEADHAVLEGGGGEAEGFEQAEALHVDRAQSPQAPSPQVNAGREEPEDPQATYGDADDVRNVTERP